MLSYAKKVLDNHRRGTMDENISLVLQAKAGDELAFSKLLTTYQPLLYSLSQRYSSMCEGEVTRDDFFQEAQIAFHKAIMSYDLDNSSITLGAYAKACVRNRLVSLVRKIKSKKRTKKELEYNCEAGSLQDKVVWRELGTKLLAHAESTLSPYEKKVFALYFKGHKAGEISKYLGKSEKSVNNAIFRIKSKLKAIKN
jgi:RNA polymerase sporulation-specific sigma factor